MFLILQEHFYDPQSGSGYLAWRIKTVQRNTAARSQRSSTSTPYQDSLKRKREVLSTDKQLLGEQCHEAISFLKHSTDESAVKEKLLFSTAKHWFKISSALRQFWMSSHDFSTSLACTTQAGTVTYQAFCCWFTCCHPRPKATKRVQKSAQFQRDATPAFVYVLAAFAALGGFQCGYDAGVIPGAMLLLRRPCCSIFAVIFHSLFHDFLIILIYILLKNGASVETFLAGVALGQPFLLCVGQKKNSIQRYYIIIDHKAIPCKAQTSLAAFDELFKAHFIFSVNYHESLFNFYTFIQTTVFNIDVGSAKESPRVKELRARFLHDA
ncbi:Proton myo-inositol cotransporter [Merluccius polli]|uniref:Proton myo-inositol cotransporter n=1 Tax=Merluccius polli TaxID=89951 RepID=A0AA47N724_MERPO|nr:Proton myo-inositol cotransporter [Merluccius polli]